MIVVVIADYDPQWPQRFVQERARIVTALGNVAKLVEHIGSTAVPGLAAKPVIDILVAVDDALAARRWNDTNDYAPAKSEVVAEIMRRVR